MQKWEVRGGMKRNVVLCIVGLSLVVIFSLLIYKEMVETEAAAFDSYLLSIHEAVTNAVHDGTIRLPVIEEWTYMTMEDTKKLEENRVFGDCRQLNSNKLIDIWGEKIQIVYRYQARFHSHPPTFGVWSKGRDRVAGTADDVIAPADSHDDTLYNLADRWP